MPCFVHVCACMCILCISMHASMSADKYCKYILSNDSYMYTCSDRAHGIVYLGYWLGTVDKYCARNSL